MKAKLLSVAVVLIALAAAPPALADSGTGALLAGLQNATTAQVAAATCAVVAFCNPASNAPVPESASAGGAAARAISTTATLSSLAFISLLLSRHGQVSAPSQS